MVKAKQKSNPKWLYLLVSFGIILTLGFLFVLPITQSSNSSLDSSVNDKTELRGVWITNVASGVLYAPWGINRAINQLSQLNFNTIYPVVWNRGYTFFPSQVAKQATGNLQQPLLTLTRGRSNLLFEMIKISHEKGLRVIPWFEYGLKASASSQLVKNHPDWLTQTQDNSTIDTYKKSNFNRFIIKSVWLNPLHPEVKKFLKDLIVEVATYYNIDGIQLDDNFAMPVEFGYDPFTIKMYQQEHQNALPPSNPRDSQWVAWRANKITELFTEIVMAVKDVDPNIKISVAPNPYGFSYNEYLQDWLTWVKRDLIEELIVQVYREDLDSFRNELDQQAIEFARKKIPVSIGILAGLSNRPIKIEQVKQQVEIVRESNFYGVSFFFWETLWSYLTPESPRQRRQVFRKMFDIKANV